MIGYSLDDGSQWHFLGFRLVNHMDGQVRYEHTLVAELC